MGVRRTWIVAGFLVAGVVLADVVRPSFVVSTALGGLGVALLTGAWMVHSRTQRSRLPLQPGELLPSLSRAAAACVLSAVLFVGVCNLGTRSAAMERSPFSTSEPRALEVEGTVVRDPFPVGRAQKIEVKTEKIDGVRARWRVSARIFAGGPHRSDLMVGDRVRLTGRFRPLVAKDHFDRALM
ncbi:MAG: hypothetical protein ACRD1T_22630, partial [Acidimicrobiia bacterium]